MANALRVNAAEVADLTTAISTEAETSGSEISLREVPRRSYQSTHVDGRTLAEQYAVGVHQKHLAIGRQTSKDLRWIGSQYPIDGDRVATGLCKPDRLCRTDAKTLPIQNGVLTRLGNQNAAGATVGDGGTASGNHPR